MLHPSVILKLILAAPLLGSREEVLRTGDAGVMIICLVVSVIMLGGGGDDATVRALNGH